MLEREGITQEYTDVMYLDKHGTWKDGKVPEWVEKVKQGIKMNLVPTHIIRQYAYELEIETCHAIMKLHLEEDGWQSYLQIKVNVDKKT